MDPVAPPPERDAAVRSEASSRLIIEIATAASGELDLDQILHQVLDRLRAVVPLTGGSIALVDGQELVIRAAIGPFANQAVGKRLPRRAGRSWSVVETLQPYRTGDVARDGDRVTAPLEAGGIRSWLAVPIVRNGVGIGLVEIDSTEPNAFDADHEALLDAVVGVLSGAVEVAAHHAEEQRAGELRDAFIGVISHELRTPVTTIYGLAGILRRRGTSLDDDTRAQAVVDIEEEADRLTRLIEDLLVLSRAERGRVQVESEPINLARLVRHITDVESERHNRRYAFRAPGELQLVSGEATYVEQVVRNFLSNAAKYSPVATTIEVHLERGDGEAIVRVLDRGIGVEEGMGDRAFELFFRSGDASRIASGAGIGLFVCRHLVQAMGGRVWLVPRPGGGTEAGFSLPIVEIDDPDLM